LVATGPDVKAVGGRPPVWSPNRNTAPKTEGQIPFAFAKVLDC
jgi:hypothetical protein